MRLNTLIVCSVFVLLQCLGAVGQDPVKQDLCSNAAGPRPINQVSSPATTVGATIDDVNEGECGVDIDTPGVWWWVNGTGGVIRASTCDERTQIKTKISVFVGSCGALRCVTGHARPDFECAVLNRDEDGLWGTISTAVDFPTFKGFHYYILVQQMEESSAGIVWLNFRSPLKPQNDHCVDAIGPVPRDKTMIIGTTEEGSVSEVPAGYCGVNDLYPGSWYQIMGTGKSITIGACSEFNFDGFYFSVYNGANCDEIECITVGNFEVDVLDEEFCTFGPARVKRPLTTFTFPTVDRDRYYIMIHYALTIEEKPTSEFRFFVDDGEGGMAGSGGVTGILFEDPPKGRGNNKGNGDDGDSNGNGNNGNSGTPSKMMVTGFVLGSSLISTLLFTLL